MNLYRETLVSNSKSLNSLGSVYTINREQLTSSIVDTYLSESITYDACSKIKKALRNVVPKATTVTMMYVFTEGCFSKFEVLASEDDSKTIIEGHQVSSSSVLSNLLYTTDSKFIAEDIPKLQLSSGSKYLKNEMYIVRLLHRVKSDENILSEDIVIYIPTRYLQ